MNSEKRWSKPQRHDLQERPLDDTFTEARPGCVEKVELMRERLERGVSLFHDLDKGIGENFRQIEDFDWNAIEASQLGDSSYS